MRLFLFILILQITFTCFAQESIEDVASLLSKHKYVRLSKCFNDEMKRAVSVSDLEKIWESLEQSGGEFQQIDNIEKKKRETGTFQSALLRFENLSMRLELSTDLDDKVSGLMIKQLGYSPPDYARNLGTGKKYINFISDDYELSGELIIPLECNNCPVVILVHGSGPNDKDETIGPNRIFYDLAMGLAKKGVATFRYDKRSNLYPETVDGQFDLYDETINDAISALNVIQDDTSLFFGKHFMLGHSLGAYAMPLIVDSIGEKLNGSILFSANARRLEDLIEYQMDYLTKYDREISGEEDEIIQKNTRNAEKIRTGNFTLETPATELLAYWPGAFWKGIATYDQVDVLSKNTKNKFLILQGEKDYQITMKDFSLWHEKVGAQKNVTLKSYPGLTHLFTPSTLEKPGPGDYFVPKNVSFEVITDIVNWITAID